MALEIKASAPRSVLASNLDIPRLPDEVFGHIFHFLNAEELASIALVCQIWNTIASSEALSYEIPFPSWLKDIDASVWEKHVDLKKYGLDLSVVPRVNRLALTKALKPLSRKVENKMGITNMVIPKGLTLNTVLRIAKDNSVPIGFIWDEILTNFGDIAVEQTRVLFFTNSIFEGTRDRTPDQHELDVATIGHECGFTIRNPGFRDFMAFLALTYMSSSENPPTQLYSSNTFTVLIEKVICCSLIGGFAPSGLFALFTYCAPGHIGFGASGSCEDIETRNIGT